MKSFDEAAIPVTLTSAPGTPSNAAGTSCPRIRSIAAVAFSSLPLPTVDTMIDATVPSALVSWVTGPLTTRSDAARSLKSAIAAATGPEVTSSAPTTTAEPAASPGKASVMRS